MAAEADDSDSGFRSVTPSEDRKPSEDREEYKRMFSFFELSEIWVLQVYIPFMLLLEKEH